MSRVSAARRALTSDSACCTMSPAPLDQRGRLPEVRPDRSLVFVRPSSPCPLEFVRSPCFVSLCTLHSVVWNSSSLLGSLHSDPRRWARKRRQLRLCDAHVVLVLEPRGTHAALMQLPDSHHWSGTFSLTIARPSQPVLAGSCWVSDVVTPHACAVGTSPRLAEVERFVFVWKVWMPGNWR